MTVCELQMFCDSEWDIKIYELWVQKYNPTIYIFNYAVSIVIFYITEWEIKIIWALSSKDMEGSGYRLVLGCSPVYLPGEIKENRNSQSW
jgi:hypothetical protein